MVMSERAASDAARHLLLERQLRRLALDAARPPDEKRWAALLRSVDAAYQRADRDRELLERSLATLNEEEVRARLATERLTALLEAAADVVAVFEPSGLLLNVNRVGARCLGIDEHDTPDLSLALSGRTIFELFDGPSGERMYHEAFPTLRREGMWRGEAALAGPLAGTPASVVLVAHRGLDGSIDHCSAIVRDASELKEVQRALIQEATHDALTGLPNRALLLDRLEHAVSRAARTGAELAVLYIDLDRVKIVNDSLGHNAGDRLLIQVSQRLREGLRTPDTVGRLGGDEFVVIAEDLEDARAGVEVARRIVADVERPFDLEGVEAFVSASVGLAFLSGPEDSAETLLRDSDTAMYRAKQAGGCRFEIFDAEMRAWATERFDMESALRHAIERNEFSVVYQPQVRAGTGELLGFEGLARWSRPSGAVGPDVFIPLAEETGLVAGIDAWVLEHACRQVVDWNARRAKTGESPLRLAVNVCGRQLTQPGLLDVVQRMLDVTRLDPAWLTLEITESVLVQDPTAAHMRLEALKELGLRVAVDDFGTGYSSLAYLQKFPLDSIKIDQVFVADLAPSAVARDTTIIASIVSLAHALNFEVVAEGVQTPEQLETLTALGCDVVQGNFVSEPLTADGAGHWVTGRSLTRRA
jgi:diguanylate cyclase (GGDEF)-like protein